jgi:hypothetical protein
MIVFHELAYEGYALSDPGNGFGRYSDPRLMELMGAVDVVHVSGYSAQVTGTSPQVFLSVEYSCDRSYFFADVFGPVIIANLSTSGETLFQGVYPQSALTRLAYGRLGITVLGTNARAFLRIWITGRDRSRRSAGMSQPQPMARPMPRVPNGMAAMNGAYGPKG